MSRGQRRIIAAALMALAGLCAVSSTSAQDALRPELKELVSQARERYKEKDYAGMLPLIAKARGLFFLTGFEKDVIDHLQGLQCRGVGDMACFRKNFIKVIESGQINRYQHLELIQAVAFSYLETNEPGTALTWFQRYHSEGGTDIGVIALIPAVAYRAYGPANPDPGLAAQIAADALAGKAPSQEQLRLLAASQIKASDGGGFVTTLEKIARLYPTKEHWSDLIWTIRTRSGFSPKLDLDVFRLLRATHALQPSDYPRMIAVAGTSGVPGEAKVVKDEGVANGQIALVPKQNGEYGERWRQSIDYDASHDHQNIAITDTLASRSEFGDGLINIGVAYVTYGDTEKGLAMLEQGLAKGNLEHPDWAKLHYGYAQYWAGNVQKARSAFKEVVGFDGSEELAQLWLMVLPP